MSSSSGRMACARRERIVANRTLVDLACPVPASRAGQILVSSPGQKLPCFGAGRATNFTTAMHSSTQFAKDYYRWRWQAQHSYAGLVPYQTEGFSESSADTRNDLGTLVQRSRWMAGSGSQTGS